MSLVKKFQTGSLDATMHRKMIDYKEQLTENVKSSGDVIASIDALFYTNPELAEAWNRKAVRDGRTDEVLNYSGVAKELQDSDLATEDDKKIASRYLRTLDTGSNPGGANVIPTTLGDVLAYRVESAGQVLATVEKINVPDGNYEHPKYNKSMLAEFKTEAGNFTDASTYYEDATDGLNKVSYTLKDFGLYLSVTERQFEKMTPSIANTIVNQVALSLGRGADDQILQGNATGENATGMIQNATTATAGANAFETFANGIGALGDVNVDPANTKAFMNTATYAHFLKLRGTNPAYAEIISGSFTNASIHGIPVVITNLIKTSGGAATVVMGDPSHYIWTTNGSIKQYEDKVAQSLKKEYVFYQLAEGKPIFNDSFAKFSVTL